MDALLDSAPCGFLSLADDNTILQMNSTLGKWLEYEQWELKGRSMDSVLSMGGRIFFQTHISPLLKMQGRAEEIYFSLKGKNGESLAVLSNAVRHERDGVFVSDFIFLPMRQRRQFEDELLEARKVAEEATHEKARFLSMMSHELRTPMNAILGFGQLLQMETVDPVHQQSVEQILKAGRHLLELINEVLDLSRIEASGLEVVLTPVSASDVMYEAFEMARPLANKANIELKIQGSLDSDLWVKSDQKRLRQILLNLLANGIKYNRPHGLVTLSCERVSAGSEETDGKESAQRLRFVVTDNGLGIAPEKLSKLFIPFERLGAEDGQVEGTGLGLTLCKHLAEAMDGHIEVHSVRGEGSSFWVEFPLAVAPELVSPVSNDEETKQEEKSSATSLLLYIEDNASNLQLVQHILAKRPSMRLLPATSGNAGLQLARAHFPDLILLDLQLPDMSGDDVLDHLLSEKSTRDIPVVVLSADATPKQSERLLKVGARAYLTKPLDVPELLALLDKMLEKGKDSSA